MFTTPRQIPRPPDKATLGSKPCPYCIRTSCHSMSSNIPNSSLSRSRSLKVGPANSLKPSTSISSCTANIQTGPSNIALFLTNLRLLDLDLQDDWPAITVATFSTKDQNQKKRIQAVEWALYQLFALWDPEETRNVFELPAPYLGPVLTQNL